MYVCVCGSDKLPAAILIRMGPNLDTTCISKMSRGIFFWNFRPNFAQKRRFSRPKIEKIQDIFSDMPCDLSNQTTLPAQTFLSLLVQSTRIWLRWVVFTGLLMWPYKKVLRAGYAKIYFCSSTSFIILTCVSHINFMSKGALDPEKKKTIKGLGFWVHLEMCQYGLLPMLFKSKPYPQKDSNINH